MEKKKQSKELKTAVIYARYSSDNQTEQSIEGQLRVCQEYAKSNNIIILDTYIDRAMTGRNDNRPAFQKMLKDSSNENWDYVLVYKFDRFSRNKYETAIHKKTLKDNGVKLMSATEYLPDTPEAIIIESMFEGYAEYYSVELAVKTKRGMRELRIKGNFQGGYVPFGYKVENKKLVIDPEKAEAVRYIFEEYLMGTEIKDIIANLTAKGIYNRGKPLARTTVYNMLKFEKYTGIYQYEDEIYDNMYPQIIPTELFEKVNSKARKNHYGRKSEKTEYLLRGKLKCGYCGRPISAETGTTRSGKVNHYYKCLGRREHICNKQTVPQEFIENLVIDSIMEALCNRNVQSLMVNKILEMQKLKKDDNYDLKCLLQEKKRTETALNNLVNALERGVCSNTTNKRLHELEEKLESIEKEIIIAESKKSFEISEEQIREYFKDSIKLEAKALINKLIDKIELFDDEVKIIYNNPINNSPDENQGFCFYTSKIEEMKIKMLI